MSRPEWGEGASAPLPSNSVPIERFLGTKIKRRIWLLADPFCRWIHWIAGQNSRPCLTPHKCPICDDATQKWTTHQEGFAPAYMQKKDRKEWVPIVAVFTASALKLLGPGPHRGLQLEMYRAKQGSVTHLRFDELGKAEPLGMPAFSVAPFMMRVWYPQDAQKDPVTIPPAVPMGVTAEPDFVTQEPSEEERAIVARMIADARSAGKLGNPANKRTAQAHPAPNRISVDLPGDRPADAQNPVSQRENAKAPAPRATAPAPRQRDYVPSEDSDLNSELDAILSQGTGRIISREVHDRLPAGHPSKRNGTHQNGNGKGGAK